MIYRCETASLWANRTTNGLPAHYKMFSHIHPVLMSIKLGKFILYQCWNFNYTRRQNRTHRSSGQISLIFMLYVVSIILNQELNHPDEPGIGQIMWSHSSWGNSFHLILKICQNVWRIMATNFIMFVPTKWINLGIIELDLDGP